MRSSFGQFRVDDKGTDDLVVNSEIESYGFQSMPNTGPRGWAGHEHSLASTQTVKNLRFSVFDYKIS